MVRNGRIKRILVGLLALVVMLTSVLPMGNGLFDFGMERVYGEEITSGDWTYRVMEDGTAEITGYNRDEMELVIPEEIDGYSVTGIGDRAFRWCSSLTEIKLPESVTSIGNEAFYYCSSLTEIELPESVTSIGYGAFENCFNLTTVKVPKNIKNIDDNTFSCCYALVDIQLPDGLLRIGKYAFSYCEELVSIEIPQGVTDIGEGAFERCSELINIEIPDGIVNVENDTFSDCYNLVDIKMPDSILNIGEGAFTSCRFKTIEIPENVECIESFAFSGCMDLSEIYIPKKVKYISGSAFSSCNEMVEITVDNENMVYDSRDNCNAIIETLSNKLIRGCDNTIIPKSVTSIGEYAFSGCDFTEIEIPECVTSIGDSAFSGCIRLTEIELPESVTSIEDNTFYYCSSLTEIEIPKSVTSIGHRAFIECTRLTEIEIPESLTDIGSEAFYNCSSLTEIKLPENVTSIGYGAFCWCNSLEQIELPNGVTRIEYNTFLTHGELSVIIPNSVYYISEYAFRQSDNVVIYSSSDSYAHSYANDNNIEWRELGNKDSTGIWSYKLLDNNTVEIISYLDEENTVIIPIEIDGKKVTSIGSNAFKNHTEIENITIPEGITTIKWNAFKGCDGLTKITIPGTVVNIGEYAFCDCDNLREVTIRDGVKSIDYNAFDGCENLTKITIPDSVINIGDSAFSGCSDITIYSSLNSYAHTYAVNNGIKWSNKEVVSLEDANITLGVLSYTYNGKVKQPNISIKYGNIILVNGTDYTVSYRNNINAGTATVVMTGIGNYTGRVTKTFEINPAMITDATLGTTSYIYDGKTKKPSVIIKFGEKALINGTDYTVTYANNINIGTATVTIKGKGNYTGTLTKTFTIEPAKVLSLKQKSSYSTSAITLTWNKVSGATGYEVYKATSKNGKYTKVKTSSSTSFKNTKLKSGKTYYYKVRAYKLVNGVEIYGDYSSIVAMGTKTAKPNIKVTAGKKQVIITWKKVTGADGYEVYMSTSKAGKYKKIKTATAKTTSFTKKKLTKGKKYYFKIRTYRKVNGKKIYSGWSSVKSTKVK